MFKILIDMKDQKIFAEGMYESPSVTSYVIKPEGMLCASGSHDSFTEDDSWQDMFE